jgi:hypothetical protein
MSNTSRKASANGTLFFFSRSPDPVLSSLKKKRQVVLLLMLLVSTLSWPRLSRRELLLELLLELLVLHRAGNDMVSRNGGRVREPVEG